MKLDKRIKSLSDILTCFDIEDAKQYIGQEGYFSDCIDLYRCLATRKYGILTEIKDSDCPFKEGDYEYWRFFIPESRLLEIKEKKFRPYTIMEFQDKFTMGQPIKFRPKGKVGWERYLILNGYWHEQREKQTITAIYIGSIPYTLDELFNEYEWQEHYTEDFKPFGVAV